MAQELTKDSDKLLCLMYESYLTKRAEGIPKSKSKYFGDSSEMHKNLVSDWHHDDVLETCEELKRAGLVEYKVYIDSSISPVKFTDSAIIYMENRFENGLKELLSYLSIFKS